MAKLKLIKDDRRLIGYEAEHAVYILGDRATGGGCWHKSSGAFYPFTYDERYFTDEAVIDLYTPVREGDKLEITL